MFIKLFGSKRSLRIQLKEFLIYKPIMSSTFYLNQIYYKVLFINQLIDNCIIMSIHYTEICKSGEELMQNWAIAELTQSPNIIEYEYSAVKNNDGCYLTINETSVFRLYANLTELMLIVNSTPDSFSENHSYNLDIMMQHVENSLIAGATCVDIGAESTRPGANPISAELEIERIAQIIPHIIEMKKQYNFLISLDSYKEEVIEYFYEQIDIINDVSGALPDRLLKQIVKSDKQYICMNSLTVPANKNTYYDIDKDILEIILEWGIKKINHLLDIGIKKEQIIIDPGVGFNKKPSQSWYILNNIHRLNALEAQVLIGHSRKPFINNSVESLDIITAVIGQWQANHHVDWLRLHSVTEYQAYSYSLQGMFKEYRVKN